LHERDGRLGVPGPRADRNGDRSDEADAADKPEHALRLPICHW